MVLLSAFFAPAGMSKNKVDTGAGASTPAVGAEHARCLVRALCRLLRKVSLHALLQGAGQMASATAGGSAGSAGVRVTEVSAVEELS